MPGSQTASVTPGDPSARGGRALKFGLALFQLPAFALLSSAKLSCSTWFLLGTSPPKLHFDQAIYLVSPGDASLSKLHFDQVVSALCLGVKHTEPF